MRIRAYDPIIDESQDSILLAVNPGFQGDICDYCAILILGMKGGDIMSSKQDNRNLATIKRRDFPHIREAFKKLEVRQADINRELLNIIIKEFGIIDGALYHFEERIQALEKKAKG